MYLLLENHENEHAPVDITGRQHVLRGRSALLGLQRESGGERPTDVTGSPSSVDWRLAPGVGRAWYCAITSWRKLFFAFARPAPWGPLPVQTGLPRAFVWY